jgi:hypothetical protein
LLAVIVQVPHVKSNRHFYGESFWAAPVLGSLQTIYDGIFPYLTLWLAPIVVCYAMFAAKKPAHAAMSDGERVGWLFASIPIVGFVSAILLTNAFSPRYFINVLPGVAVAFACLMRRVFHERRWMSVLILVILLGFGGSKVIYAVRHPERIKSFGSYQDEIRDVLAREDQIWLDGKKFTLMPHLLVLPARYYSHHPERYMKWTPTPPPPDAMIPAWFTDTIVERAREIAFVNPDWALLERLRKGNLRLYVRAAGSVTLVYAD